jgi:molecular chaperone DnaJ
MDDHYATLGVEHTASSDDITRAYRKLAMKWHPDRNHGNENAVEAMFKRIKEAYEVLSDTQRRAQYDLGFGYGNEEDSAYNPGTYGFAGSWQRQQQRRYGPAPEKGEDLTCKVTVPFETAMFGGAIDVDIKVEADCRACDGEGKRSGFFTCPKCEGRGWRTGHDYFDRSTCRTCHGYGRVHDLKCDVCKGKGEVKSVRTLRFELPAGVCNGQRMRCRNAGHEGIHGGPRGDVFCTIKIKSDSRYRISGLNVIQDVKVDYVTATLGGQVEVEFWGRKHLLNVPSACRAGRVLTLEAAALRNPSTGETGYLKCRVVLEMPEGVRNLTREHRQILRAMFSAAAARSK